MPLKNKVNIRFQADGKELNFRRHSVGQGGFDNIPFTPKVVDRLKQLQPEVIRIFVQEYFAMMPSVEMYDWSKIDPAVDAIVKCGATPLLALCMKPSCLFPVIDLKSLIPSDWNAWEDFIEAMVRHFSEEKGWKGLWYEVGNEPDIGGGAPYLFGEEGASIYAETYERTVRAVLRADPSAKVGGPALASAQPFKSKITHELIKRVHANKVPLDFFSWHSYHIDPVAHQYNLELTLAELKKTEEPFSSAITIINEWNSTPIGNMQIGEYRQSSFLVDVVWCFIKAGLDYSCYYHIMDVDFDPAKWANWYPTDDIKKMYKMWGAQYRGLHLMSQDGTPKLPYVALLMLSKMNGRAVADGNIDASIRYTVTTRDNCCRILIWNYGSAECTKGDINLELEGLPHVAIKETHYSLSGHSTWNPTYDEICAVRKGELHVASKCEHPPGEPISKTIECWPFSVHLLEFSW